MIANEKSVGVIVPAFNEEAVIAQVLEDVCRFGYEVVVVDDGSSDSTVALCRSFPVTLLRHVLNLGQGAALQTGLDYLLERSGIAYIVTFDADGQHQADDIPVLIKACKDPDIEVVLGSRFIAGAENEDIPGGRRALLRLATLFTRLITGLSVTDTHNGLRAFTREAAAKMDLKQNGMAHASEILSRISVCRLPYVEVAVTVSYTEYSKSKGQSLWNSVNIIWEMIEGLTK